MREAIFSALESWNLVRDARVLDLYAGSGALGLEAASRGAREVTLVEKHAPAAQVAARNAKTVQRAFTHESAPAITVVRSSVQSYLESLDHAVRFDVMLLDPPYDVGEQELAANLHSAAQLLVHDGVMMVERSTRSPEPTWPARLERFREKRYGETVLWWAEPAQEQP